MGPVEMVRSVRAQRAAAANYVAQHQRFLELKLQLMLVGSEIDAEGAHAYALTALRAHVAELDDPEPPAVPYQACCAGCMAYRLMPYTRKPVPGIERI